MVVETRILVPFWMQLILLGPNLVRRVHTILILDLVHLAVEVLAIRGFLLFAMFPVPVDICFQIQD